MTLCPLRIPWLAVLTILVISVVLSACSDNPAPTPVPPDDSLWQYDAGTEDELVIVSPTVADGVVYAGSYENQVYALDAETGELLWQFEVPGDWYSPPPIVGNGVVVVGAASQDTLYVLDGSTGELLWSTEWRGGGSVNTPAVSGSTLYVGSGSGEDFTVSAIDVSGNQIWSSTVPRSIFPLFFPLTAVGNNAYVSDNHRVHALSAATGEKVWTAELATQAPPTVYEGRVYFVANHTAQALDETTGELIWSYKPVITGTRAYLRAPAVVDGICYLPADELHALDAAIGSLLWSAEVDLGIGTPVVAGDMVFATSIFGDLYALEATTGDVAWTSERGGRLQMVDGILYSHSPLTHELRAFDPSTGKPVWIFSEAYFVGGEGDSYAVSGNVVYVSYVPTSWAAGQERPSSGVRAYAVPSGR